MVLALLVCKGFSKDGTIFLISANKSSCSKLVSKGGVGKVGNDGYP